MTTKATLTIEIEVPVAGNWCRAEPDVGLNESRFEDAQIDFNPDTIRAIIDAAEGGYDETIQEALAEAKADEEQDRGDWLHDQARDKMGEEE